MGYQENLGSLRDGFESAYIDGNLASSLDYKPSFISNNPYEGKKVISSIEDELLRCERFQISVAFITMGGITPLLQTLKELENRGVPGQILTTNYLNFSEPRALQKLNELKNIDIRMYDVDEGSSGFHTKGYIFKKHELYRIIIGSSNITSSALTTSREWNTKVISTEQGEIAIEIVNEFNSLWSSPYTKKFDEFYERYSKQFLFAKQQQSIARQDKEIFFDKLSINLNSMQIVFVDNLRQIIRNNDRALLISATGTGKTIASAYAMRELGYKKVLFLVHRVLLAEQALESFRRIFPDNKSMGLVGNDKYEFGADFVFATIQTIEKDENLFRYKRDHFEAIILDEAHHGTSDSYKKIFNYFTPKLFLGMTATPDKRDDGREDKNIYALFNYNIAHEIRLQQAMQDNLLCPFHYFGISDKFSIRDNIQSEKDLTPKDFSLLTSDERIKQVVEKATYFGYSGKKVKGLIFCRGVKESEELSRKFNSTINPDTGRLFKTIALSSDTKAEQRNIYFEKLASDNPEESIDYILSCDLLNEGVDIVEVNQVIMLRPTQSPIIFIQQLGRGLRKARNKEYVVVLDFIGNYQNNFLIPIALSGDRSYNKDSMRRYVSDGMRIIPGSSTIHFDEISKSRIFDSIDKAKTNNVKLLKEEYFNLKRKIGRIPTALDFKKFGAIEISKFSDNASLGSYYSFLVKYEPEFKTRLNPFEKNIVEFISQKVLLYKRIHDLALLKLLIQERKLSSKKYCTYVERSYGITTTPLIEKSVRTNLTNLFGKDSEIKEYNNLKLIDFDSDEKYQLSQLFELALKKNEFAMIIKDLIEYGIKTWEEKYNLNYKGTLFTLFQKYDYEDVCRLLCWDKNINARNIGGYFYDKSTKTLPVFINYEKEEGAIDYKDRFVSDTVLIALSKKPRSIEKKASKKSKTKQYSSDVEHIYKKTDRDRENRIFLFVRKNKDDKEAKEFYFLGEIFAKEEPKPLLVEGEKAFEIEYHLDIPVRSDIYDYIVKK